jgi:arginyl-tRNA synthetase
MKRINNLLLLVFFLMTGVTVAAQRSADEALKLAEQFVASNFNATRAMSSYVLTLADPVACGAKRINGKAQSAFYIFNVSENRGFVIVSADTRFKDVLGYSTSGNIADEANLRAFSVAYLQNEQDSDLRALGVSFDNFYLESSLYSNNLVKRAVDAMIASGQTYESEGALWLKTTEFPGIIDDKDRVMRKTDGTFTYFVPDVAYHLAKFDRGFTKAINIQGSDHHGTIARVRIGFQAAAKQLGMQVPGLFPDYVLHKMLKVIRDGQEVKMSKRSGTYVTLRDLVNWVGKDAARFFLVSRKADSEFVFDIDLALSQSDENPVYYLQYAHARICSVLAQAQEKGFAVPSNEQAAAMDLSSLTDKSAEALMNRLSEFGKTLTVATKEFAPHTLCFYLKDLAADFHAFYNAQRILVDNEAERNARLALLLATRQVLRNGFALLGISAPTKM